MDEHSRGSDRGQALRLMLETALGRGVEAGKRLAGEATHRARTLEEDLRARREVDVAAMVAGLCTCFYYMATTHPWLRSVFGVTGPVSNYIWFDIQPISAGVFGVPVGVAVLIVVSLLTPAPDRRTQQFVEHVRYPRLASDPVPPGR